jgi:hypothetical protein
MKCGLQSGRWRHQVDKFVLTLRKHIAAQAQKSFDTGGRFSYSAGKSSLHTSLGLNVYFFCAIAAIADSSAPLLSGYQCSPGDL